MHVAQCRAERYHVEAGIVLLEERALQAGVDCLDGGTLAVKLLVGIGSQTHHGGIEVGRPCRVAFAMLYGSAGESEYGLDLVGDVEFTRIDAGALGGRPV